MLRDIWKAGCEDRLPGALGVFLRKTDLGAEGTRACGVYAVVAPTDPDANVLCTYRLGQIKRQAQGVLRCDLVRCKPI